MTSRPFDRAEGFILPFSVVAAIVMGGILLATALVLKMTVKQNTHITFMDRARRQAESAFNIALGELTLDPDISQFSGAAYTAPFGEGGYSSTVSLSDFPLPCHYIVTDSTIKRQGKLYTCRLHTYVEISSVSEYFAAVNDFLGISHGADISQGKIYGVNLQFDTDVPGAQTKVKRAEFLGEVNPPINAEGQWPDSIKALVAISEPAVGVSSGSPVALSRPLLFPQFTSTDAKYYKTLANTHTSKNIFSGIIYPPGYVGGKKADDLYSDHTNSNEDHVYYSEKDMYVEGAVRGQVLFVSTCDIHITGNITRYDADDSDNTTNLPGAGSDSLHASSSTANQAILIAKGNIILDRVFTPLPVTVESTVTIRAMLMAPNGGLIPVAYDATSHDNLRLDFIGALIVNTLNSVPNLQDVYGGQVANRRLYAYMDSLATHPPPYLPALARILYQIEE